MTYVYYILTLEIPRAYDQHLIFYITLGWNVFTMFKEPQTSECVLYLDCKIYHTLSEQKHSKWVTETDTDTESFEPQHDKINKMTDAPSADSDQPGHSLGAKVILLVLSCAGSYHKLSHFHSSDPFHFAE